MFIVPDDGAPKGDKIEIAEKSILWLKVTVKGKQAHASVPEEGLNAFREAAKYALEADAYLHKKYIRKTELFPNGSTFEMTKHEKNVENINILPGEEVFYIDCRILPEYDVAKVAGELRRIGRKYRAKIKVEEVNKEKSGATSADSEIVNVLKKSIKEVLHQDARLVGIGGSTMAGVVRKAGFDAVAWDVEKTVAHQPNECMPMEDVVKTAKVLVRVFTE
ncbi:putative metallohydrolase [uncultured archaeon]|nr:putative metallohydrolase [uncultured archaeon]